MSWPRCNLSVSQLRRIVKSVTCICLFVLLQTNAEDSRIDKISFARSQEVKPITKHNLLSALKLGEKQKTKVETYIDLIKEHYVEFKMTDGDEQEIRNLGKYLGKEDLDKLIFSIRANYAYGIALTSARIIQNVEKGISLIELNITNRREEVFQAHNIEVSGTGRYIACIMYSPAPPLQEVFLNWTQIVSKKASNETGAWTRLTDANVRVQVKYQGPGCDGTIEHIRISIPVLNDLAPQSVNRILIKIVEQFPIEEYTNRPRSLADWRSLEVSIDPSDDVYPQRVRMSVQ